jgi:hypothetical protein
LDMLQHPRLYFTINVLRTISRYVRPQIDTAHDLPLLYHGLSSKIHTSQQRNIPLIPQHHEPTQVVLVLLEYCCTWQRPSGTRRACFEEHEENTKKHSELHRKRKRIQQTVYIHQLCKGMRYIYA